ncbi:MAG: AMP-binding protein [Thermodesulfobacteriota bacterium]|nr:AMP-binding protein [Thermodesulfobacteriota bacterium]
MVVSEPYTTEIATQQLPLLQRHLHYLQQVSPHYRTLFQQAGFCADEFHSMTDLTTLPLTSKGDLTEHNRDFLAVTAEQVVDICQTSGMTGNPVTIWQTENDLQRLARNEQLAFLAAGIVNTDRVLIGAALDRVFMAGLAYFLGLRQIGATAIRAGSGQPGLVAELICQQRPNVLVGVPSLLLLVAQQLRQRGENPAELGIDKLICIGEPIRNDDLSLSPLGEALQEHWATQVLGTYASTEMATAFADCSSGCGGHLLPELVILEILDNDGLPLPVGEVGEVVVTPLGIEGTPLLRYRTGDIARLHPDPCRCGRKTPRLGPILGRRAQMLKCRGTTLFPATISSVLQGLNGIQGHYLEVYSEFDLSDRLRVVVGCSDPDLSVATVAASIAAKTRVKPEVILVTPEEINSKTIRPELRKPVTFFDYRNGGKNEE